MLIFLHLCYKMYKIVIFFYKKGEGMKKKVLLLGGILVIMCFILTGCGNENNTQKAENSKSSSNSSSTSSQTTSNNVGKELKFDVNDLYSDNEKLVFKNTNTSYIILPYENGTITQHFTCLIKENNQEAQTMYDAFKKESSNNGLQAYVIGNYYIYEHSAENDEYIGQNVSTMKMAYSSMEQTK